MSEFSSFTPGMPLTLTLCLEEDSILLSEAVLEALGHPRQVQMLINQEQQMLLLQAGTVDDREAIVIPPLTLEHFEMSGHSLLRRIRRLTGWTDNYPGLSTGTSVPRTAQSYLIFALPSHRRSACRWTATSAAPVRRR